MRRLIFSLLGTLSFFALHATDYFITGQNVNGKGWTLKAPDCKFTEIQSGVYRWSGTVLGSGFKINDGTWEDETNIIGSNGTGIGFKTLYFYRMGGTTWDIIFNGFDEVENPVVEFDTNRKTISIIGGTLKGISKWYAAGFNGLFALGQDELLSPVPNSENLFSGIITVEQQYGEFKISSIDWAITYGTNFPDVTYLHPDNLGQPIHLVPVDPIGGNIPYELPPGNYKVTFDSQKLDVSVIPYEAVDNAAYYVITGNQGDKRMQEVDNGLYILDLYGRFIESLSILKVTSANNSYLNSSGGKGIDLNNPYKYVEGIQSEPIAFEGFDLLINPTIYLNSKEGTVTLLSGSKYYSEATSADYPEVLYIESEDINGVQASAPLTKVANGIYTWAGESLGGFKIKDSANTPEFTIGSANHLLSLDMPYPYVAGRQVLPIYVNGTDRIYKPSLVLDLNKWELTLKAGTNGVNPIGNDVVQQPQYFNVHGIKIANPEKGGIYIKVVEGKAEKVII